MLYLTEADVRRLVDMPTTIGVVEEMFRHLATAAVVNMPRHRAVGKGLIVHTLSAAAEYLGCGGWKAYATTKHGAKFHVGLYDAATGETSALIEADWLGQLRTGAATGVASKYLAAPDADALGLFGAGTQARTQLAAVVAVRPIRRVVVYGRNPERLAKFVDEVGREYGIEVSIAPRPAEAAALPIVITATSSRTPVFDGADLRSGAFVAAVGSNWLNKAEVDATAVRRAARVVCDDVAACRHEAGDLAAAVQAGAFDWEQAVALADVVAGNDPGRNQPAEIVLFKSVGLAAEDVALAAEIVRRARLQNVGLDLNSLRR